MSAVAPADPDVVAIVTGSDRFEGWQTVAISRSCETIPNNFSLSASTEFLQGAALKGTQPGLACQIYIGTDLVINGKIDRRTINLDAHGHMVTLTGRGLTRNLVDCSADIANDPTIKGGSINAKDTLDLATRVSKAYGVKVISAVQDLGIAIPNFQVRLGETPYEIIESVARYARYLVYENEAGMLVLDRVGTLSMAAGFTVPGNVEAITAERSVDGRYSDYIVVASAIYQLADLSPTQNQRAAAQDPTLGEHRVKIMVSSQYSPAFDIAEAMAKWEKGRRIGRAQAAILTCDAWRDAPPSGGTPRLWTPNRLATINAPVADIVGANWIIGSVTFRKDLSGTHADLVLMPPDAFAVEPNPLNLFDAQLVNSPTTSNPAPASAAPAAPATGGFIKGDPNLGGAGSPVEGGD